MENKVQDNSLTEVRKKIACVEEAKDKSLSLWRKIQSTGLPHERDN